MIKQGYAISDINVYYYHRTFVPSLSHCQLESQLFLPCANFLLKGLCVLQGSHFMWFCVVDCSPLYPAKLAGEYIHALSKMQRMFIDCKVREIMYFVASIHLSVSPSVNTLSKEPRKVIISPWCFQFVK